MYRSIILISLKGASEDYKILNIGQLIHAQNKENRRYEVCGQVLWDDRNILIDPINMNPLNGVLRYCQQFHCPTSVEHLVLNCKVEYSNTNQQIIPQSHHIWVQYMENADHNLDTTFQGWGPSFAVFHISWTAPILILKFQDRLPTGTMLLTLSKSCIKPQKWILCHQAQEYSAVIPIKYIDLHGNMDCINRFIQVVKLADEMHIVSVEAIIKLGHLMRGNARLDRIDRL